MRRSHNLGIVVCLILLSFSSICLGWEFDVREWETKDQVLFGTALTLQTIDYLQTRESAIKQPELYHESNGILPHNPTEGQLLGYVLISTTIKYVVASGLDKDARTLWLLGLNMISLYTTTHNHSVGVRIKF